MDGVFGLRKNWIGIIWMGFKLDGINLDEQFLDATIFGLPWYWTV